MKDNEIIIGRVISSHGVRGLFKVETYGDSEAGFFIYKDCFHINDKKINIKKKFNKGKLLVCESIDIKNRLEVSTIVNKNIVISEKDLIKKNNKEYFHKDLIGCSVVDENKKKLGTVKSVHNFGAGDILELDSKYPFMIRFGAIKEEQISLKDKIIKVVAENYKE